MTNSNDLIGKVVLGNCVNNVVYQNDFIDFYSSKSVSDNNGILGMICKMTFPSESQCRKISEAFSGDKDKIEKYISDNIGILKSNLDTVKSLSKDNNSIAPIYDYEIIKNPDGFSYDLHIHTCYMLPLKEYVYDNGITVSKALTFGMQILNACSYAASNDLCHKHIDTDLLFVDAYGKCKVFGFGVMAPAYSEDFDIKDAVKVNKSAEIASVSYCLYKIFNSFEAPFEYNGYNEDNLKDISQKMQSGVIRAPQGANEEVYNLIFRGFVSGSGEYASCDEYAIAVGRTINITDKIYLGAEIISSDKKNKSNASDIDDNQNPNFTQQTYYVASNNSMDYQQSQNMSNSQYSQGNNGQYSMAERTVEMTDSVKTEEIYEYVPMPELSKRPKKRSKAIIALIIILSLLLVGVLTTFLLWKFDVISLSFIPGFESSESDNGNSAHSQKDDDDDEEENNEDDEETDSDISIKILSEDITVDYGKSMNLPVEVEGCDFEDLTFESSDTSIVTVSEDGTITGISEGNGIIYIYDPDENEIATLNIVVNPKPDKIDVNYIESMLPSHSDYGIYVYDIADRKEYLFDSSHNVMGSSALVCLPLVYTYGYALEQGAMTEDTTITYHHTYANGRGRFKAEDDGDKFSVKEIMSTMLAYGDNNCMNSLMNCFGIEKINEVCEYSGIVGVDVRRNLDPNPALEDVENKITAYACGQIMDKIMYDNASPGKNFMTTYFRMKDVSARKGLLNSIPNTVEVLNHNAVTSEKYNEVIYVKDGSQEYVVVFLSLAHHKSNQANNVTLASNIGEYIYESFAAYNN